MTLLKTNTLVSIVIPAYNVGRYIEEPSFTTNISI